MIDGACPVGVVGHAPIAGGIAQVLAEAGFAVRLFAADAQAARQRADFARRMIGRKAEKGTLDAAAADRAMAAIRVVDGWDALAPCPLVIESALAPPEPTQAAVARLEAVLDDAAVIALNTSSHPVSVLAAQARRPERVAGLHFFEPAPLMRVVEVIAGLRTGADALARVTALAECIGHRAVAVRDSPGFVVNHVGRALLTEGLRIVGEQIAAPAAVDAIARETLGLRMGPFELLDLTGLDVTLPVIEQIHRDFQYEPRLRPTPLLALRAAAGLLGGKDRPGFAAQAQAVDPGPADTVPPMPLPPVWIDPGEPDLARRVRAHLDGAAFDDAPRPGAESLCLLTPLGADCTTACLRQGLDPRRCVAVDAFSGLSPRATLMAPPTLSPAMRAAATALFAGAGAVGWIGDSPGFVAQRLLAAIVNIGCDVAQQGIADAADIDAAVALALGYPKGPLAWGDAAGSARLLAVLDAMHDIYRDPRDRASPWLRRRAALGISLLHHG